MVPTKYDIISFNYKMEQDLTLCEEQGSTEAPLFYVKTFHYRRQRAIHKFVISNNSNKTKISQLL